MPSPPFRSKKEKKGQVNFRFKLSKDTFFDFVNLKILALKSVKIFFFLASSEIVEKNFFY